MKLALAIFIGRILRVLGRFVNRSSNLPGQVALKICPDFLGRLKIKGKVIAVTGSNGKTTTSNLIAHILRENGHTVANNFEGANLTAGVTTTMLSVCNYGGVVAEDFVVLEVDERFARFIFKYFSPDIFVVTNLVRDQVVRNGHPDIIMDKINEAIKPGVLMVLNANDPISQNLAPDNTRVYYAMEATERSTTTSEYITHDSKVCPKCFHKLDYEYYHYNHIGKFDCSNCGYHTPEAQYLATDVNFETGEFKVNGVVLKANYNASFHFLNMTAAIGACTQAGLKIEDCAKAASSFIVSKERYDEFDIGGRKAVLVLTKQNSVSLDQSISYALSQPGEKTIVLFVNNAFYTENKDISWLYDVTFERMLGKVHSIVCSGSRAVDVGVRRNRPF